MSTRERIFQVLFFGMGKWFDTEFVLFFHWSECVVFSEHMFVPFDVRGHGCAGRMLAATASGDFESQIACGRAQGPKGHEHRDMGCGALSRRRFNHEGCRLRDRHKSKSTKLDGRTDNRPTADATSDADRTDRSR